MDKKYLNETINPKDDFYGFATGSWHNYHPQPDDEPSWGNFDLIEKTVTERLRDVFSSLDESDPMQAKIAAYRRVYTNYDKRNAERTEPLEKYISQIQTKNSKEELLEWFTREFEEDLFCSISLFQDMQDSTRYEVYIEQSLDLDNRDYYVSMEPQNVEIRNKYREILIDVLKMTGRSAERSEYLFDKYFSYETQLAKCAYSQEKLQHPEENYHRYTLPELSQLINFDVKTLLSWSDFTETDLVIVSQPEFIEEAFRVIGDMTLEDMKDVIEYCLVTMFVCKCSEDFGEKMWEFEQFMSGAKERSPKWKRETLHLNSVFYEPVGKIYSERYFSANAKQKMMDMVSNIIEAYKEIISEQSWMSDETKQKALEKLSLTGYSKIGFPDKWEDYSSLPVDESLSYLDNEIAIVKWSHEFTIRKYYNKPYDPTEWPMMPQTVNACCMQQNNEICFPAAILQPPFFSEDADDASNYGAIGVIIGHEITHNFDTAGRLFSKDGNMEDWWTEGDAEKFKELTENTQKRFDSLYALPFVKCDGALTLNENIADYGGLKIAYEALQKKMASNAFLKTKQNGTLTQYDYDVVHDVKDGYTWEQRFFISYAQVWANTETDEYVRRSIQNNCHSVPMIRVNGTLPMFTPWYEAFDVKETDKLYVSEDKRAKVW